MFDLQWPLVFPWFKAGSTRIAGEMEHLYHQLMEHSLSIQQLGAT